MGCFACGDHGSPSDLLARLDWRISGYFHFAHLHYLLYKREQYLALFIWREKKKKKTEVELFERR